MSAARFTGTLALAIVALAGYIVLIDRIPGGGSIDLVLAVAATIAGAAAGRRLPLLARLLITGLLFDFGYSMCLAGRTTGPGLTGETIGMAVLCFGIYAFGFHLSLLRVWGLRQGLVLLAAAFPLSFAFAALVAGFEETQFVEQHRATGVGPTARWTVSHHWLAYDVKEQRLYGSD